MPADPPSGSGGEITPFGRYELIAKLASGGMGDVYLARTSGAAGFLKHLVIKQIKPHLVEQETVINALVNEAKLLVMLDHPNIVQVQDLGIEDSIHYMAMEFVNGYNLSSLIGYHAKHKRLIPAPVCVYIVLEMLAGLEYIHGLARADGTRMNILHRDVSPQNVLISREGRVKLSDFGIAKVLQDAGGAVVHRIRGKLRYMAPEALNQDRIDHRYDLFAAGIVLFESLCRAHLYHGKNDQELMKQVRMARIPPASRYHPGLPDELAAVTLRALDRDPARRYQTAAEFASALREAILPDTVSDAAAELKLLVADTYSRPDFPVGKPKLPEIQNTPASELLPDQETSGGGVMEDVKSTPPLLPVTGAGRINPLVIFLLAALACTIAAVFYLSYRLQLQPAQAVTAQETAQPLSPRQGAAAFRKAREKISRCLDRHFKGPASRLQVISRIRGDGRVKDVRLLPRPHNNTPLGRCVIRAAFKISYPPHDRPVVTFRQPLHLAGGKP